MAQAEDLEGARQRLELVRVAKDVFVSDWYADSARSMFGEETRDRLLLISEESRREREQAFALLREWSLAERPMPREGSRALAALMARDFLEHLREIKQASAEIFQKIALVAPPEYRERLLRLAALDVRHALDLHDMVLKEFPDAGQLMVPSSDPES